jgi:hypothetical protein
MCALDATRYLTHSNEQLGRIWQAGWQPASQWMNDWMSAWWRMSSRYITGKNFGVRSSSCGRQTVDQFVWVSGSPLEPMTRFYLSLLFSTDNYFILLSMASSLTRKRVCSLDCNHSLVWLSTPNNHTLPSHLRLCSLSVASYDSQGQRWKYSNPPPHGSLKTKFHLSHI